MPTNTEMIAHVDKLPLEISTEEYNDLLMQVKGLTVEEAKEEILDCARYGEIDLVRAILQVYGMSDEKVVDCIDGSGSTPLHKACANGHVSTTRLLLLSGAQHLANQSGNTPLHWASASGHDKIVKLLLDHEPFKADMDVLRKNSFGRSSLTEGFSSKNTQLVKLLLEHDSSTEERLLSGGKEMDDEVDGEDTAESTNDSSDGRRGKVVVHQFDFRAQPNDGIHGDSIEEEPVQEQELTREKVQKKLLIRELPIAHADNPFGDSAVEDTTGYGIWCASLAMARWMASSEISSRFSGKSVLELGAGCGVPGLAAALYSDARRVYITDLNPTTVRNAQHNIELNADQLQISGENGGNGKRVLAFEIDWDNETTWPTEKLDYVIGSDLIYQSSIVPLLKKVVLGLLKPNKGRFLYVAPDDGRDGLPEFIDSMKSDGCRLVSQKVAPASFHANPLSNQDDDECFVHFHELASSTYILYEFEIS